MVVILLWAKYFAPKPPVVPPQASRPAVTSPASPNPGTNKPSAPPSTAGSHGPATGISAVQAASIKPKSETQERNLVVENDLYRVEFSNHGAVVKSWQLKKYTDDAKPPRVLDVVHPEAAQQTGGWPFALALDDEQLGKAANDGLYKIALDGIARRG